jgi:hypothetical protein
MTEEPEQDRDAQAKERKDTDRGKVGEFFRKRKGFWGTSWRNFKEVLGQNPIPKYFVNNPTVFLSLLYLYVTGIGLLYSLTLYGKFGINIVDYADIADFLVAAFKNPYTLIYVGMIGILSFLNVALTAAFEGRSRGLMVNVILWGLFILVALPATFGIAAGRETASSIKDGKTPVVNVRYRSFSSSADPVAKSGLQLIGSTQRVVFFYEEGKRTIVIPQSQIVSIEVPE